MWLGNLQFSISNFQLEDKISLEGRQENLGKYYKEADCFLMTSNSEGWGLVVTEASAYGLPIIMTAVGLAGEFIKNGENGIVIPIGDERALFSAMKRVINDEVLRKQFSENVRCSFEALPSAKVQIEKQVEEWAKIV